MARIDRTPIQEVYSNQRRSGARRRVWAPNGLRFRPMVCAWCGHHIGNEAMERGYYEKNCPNCKAVCEFHIDRTDEERDFDAYTFQERRVMSMEPLGQPEQVAPLSARERP